MDVVFEIPVQQLIRECEGISALSPSLIAEYADATLRRNLSASAVWLLIALADQEQLQEHLCSIAEQFLGVSGQRLARLGYCGHPPDVSPDGRLPGITGWSYMLHGRGCRFTHDDGTTVEVDFDDNGKPRRFTKYFFRIYLDTVAELSIPLQGLKQPAVLRNAWEFHLRELQQNQLVDGTDEFRLTDNGRDAASELQPLVKYVSYGSSLQQCTALLGIGDFPAALQRASNVAESLHNIIADSAKRIQSQHAQRILQVVRFGETGFDRSNALLALASLGPDVAAIEVARVFNMPCVDVANKTALEILHHWHHPDLLNMIYERIRTWPQNGFETEEAEVFFLTLIRICLELVLVDDLPHDIFQRMVGSLSRNEFRIMPVEAGFLLSQLDAAAGLAQLAGDVFAGGDLTPSRAAMLAVINSLEALNVLHLAAKRDDATGWAASAALNYGHLSRDPHPIGIEKPLCQLDTKDFPQRLRAYIRAFVELDILRFKQFAKRLADGKSNS